MSCVEEHMRLEGECKTALHMMSETTAERFAERWPFNQSMIHEMRKPQCWEEQKAFDRTIHHMGQGSPSPGPKLVLE